MLLVCYKVDRRERQERIRDFRRGAKPPNGCELREEALESGEDVINGTH